MPLKPVKRGYKVWCLADSETGFVIRFEVYTGKTTEKAQDDHTLGEKVVLNLCSHANLDPWMVVAFDNSFTSVHLAQELYSQQLYSVGTVRSHRKGLPAMLKSKSKLKQGEYLFQTNGPVSAVKLMDNKEVTMLSTCCYPKETTEVKRCAKDGTQIVIPCPLVVSKYNLIMGGVDRFDQLRERYAVSRSFATIKWWHCILYWLIDLAIVNAFIMFQVNKTDSSTVRPDQLRFRLLLARQLTKGYERKPKRGRPVSFLANKRTVPDDVRLA